MFLGLRRFWVSAHTRGVVARRQGAKEASFLDCHIIQQCALYRRFTLEESQEIFRLVKYHGKNWTYIGHILDRPSMSVRQVYERKECPTFYRAWTPDELEKLKELVLAHGDDWATIRASMPYDRPVNVLKTKWREKVNPDIRQGPFSPEEEVRLKEAVSRFGKDWKKIATHVQHRTAKQCNCAWKSLVQTERNASKRYSRFTPEEDQAIVDAVEKHGSQDFQVICDAMESSRWPSVLRNRYFDYLDPAIDRSPWTDEEEKRVHELYQQFGRQARQIKRYLGSKRSRIDIEAHCRLYEKKKKKEAQLSIDKPAGRAPSV